MANDKIENKEQMIVEDPQLTEQQTRTDCHVLTRVSPEVYSILKGISERYGYSIFQLVRMLAETIVRFCDDRHNLSEELMRIIRMFENIPGWKKSICLADEEQEFGIVEAIYIIRAKGKDGYRLCLVERPMMEDDPYGWSATYNAQRILERLIEVMNPSLYKHLRSVAVEMGTNSMLDMLHRIADDIKENPDEKDLRELFESNDWNRGARMSQDTHYKRPYTPSEEHLQKTLFDNQ